LNVPDLLDLARAEAAVDFVLQQKDWDSRVPTPNTCDANPRESDIVAMGGDVDSINLRQITASELMERDEIVKSGI
jgi:hypothetical protein